MGNIVNAKIIQMFTLYLKENIKFFLFCQDSPSPTPYLNLNLVAITTKLIVCIKQAFKMANLNHVHSLLGASCNKDNNHLFLLW